MPYIDDPGLGKPRVTSNYLVLIDKHAENYVDLLPNEEALFPSWRLPKKPPSKRV